MFTERNKNSRLVEHLMLFDLNAAVNFHISHPLCVIMNQFFKRILGVRKFILIL